MKVLLSPEAEQDLIEACAYVAGDNPGAASRLLARFEEICELLAAALIEGREVVLTDGRAARAWSLRPYRIYYRRRQGAVEILRLYHQAQRPIER